ncbi:MAG: SGNH/GDSL hydrolase family protein [Microgenomates group bacterium]
MNGFEVSTNTYAVKELLGLGGSITNNTGATGADGFLPKIGRWLNVYSLDRYAVTNKGIDGKDSWYSLIRLQTDVIDLAPDLIIYDCAINDNDQSPYAKCEEAVIRRLRTALPDAKIAGIIFGTTANRLGTDPTNTKATTAAQVREILTHYGILYADQTAAVVTSVNAGTYTLAQIFADTIHPADVGHLLGKQTLDDVIPTALTQTLPSLPTPLHDTAGDYSQTPIIRVANDNDGETGVWAESGTDEASSTADSTITWTGAFSSFGFDTGYGASQTYAWQIDGGAWTNVSPSTVGYTNNLLWSGARGAHTVVVKVVTGTITVKRFLAV